MAAGEVRRSRGGAAAAGLAPGLAARRRDHAAGLVAAGAAWRWRRSGDFPAEAGLLSCEVSGRYPPAKIIRDGHLPVNVMDEGGDYVGSRKKIRVYGSCWRPFFATTSLKL